MFADLSPDFIDHLKGSVELQRFAPGQIIARQGDAAHSFYLVRIGFVKISETYPGGELVLAYLSRGDYFGEIALLRNTPRTASVRTLAPCLCLSLNRGHFLDLMDRVPDLRREIDQVAQTRNIALAEETIGTELV